MALHSPGDARPAPIAQARAKSQREGGGGGGGGGDACSGRGASPTPSPAADRSAPHRHALQRRPARPARLPGAARRLRPRGAGVPTHQHLVRVRRGDGRRGRPHRGRLHRRAAPLPLDGGHPQRRQDALRRLAHQRPLRAHGRALPQLGAQGGPDGGAGAARPRRHERRLRARAQRGPDDRARGVRQRLPARHRGHRAHPPQGARALQRLHRARLPGGALRMGAGRVRRPHRLRDRLGPHGAGRHAVALPAQGQRQDPLHGALPQHHHRRAHPRLHAVRLRVRDGRLPGRQRRPAGLRAARRQGGADRRGVVGHRLRAAGHAGRVHHRRLLPGLDPGAHRRRRLLRQQVWLKDNGTRAMSNRTTKEMPLQARRDSSQNITATAKNIRVGNS